MYLLDTNVVSELRKRRPHGAVLAWLDAAPAEALLVSAATMGELQIGVERTRRQDAAKAEELERWVNGVPRLASVVPADDTIFRVWARLMVDVQQEQAIDALIAATARVHGLTVATRNVRDFVRFGVPTLNPFAPAR